MAHASHTYPDNAIRISDATAVKTEQARQALGVLRKTLEQWFVIGAAIVALRERANELGGRKTFHRLLEQQGLGTFVKAKAVTSRLEKVMAHQSAVIDWYRQLPPAKQIEWASPSSVLQHCPIFKKQASVEPAQRKPRVSKMHLEVAIDTLTDHLRELETDEGMLVIDRIVSPLGLAVRGKKDGKAKAVKPGPLKWKATGNESLDSTERTGWRAPSVSGEYRIGVATMMSFGGGATKFGGYFVEHNIGRHSFRIREGVSTEEKAKGIAQRDHDQGGPLQ